MPSRKEVLEQAYEKAISSFMIDMPLILHGSGDSLPASPETARELAAMTADYIQQLVEAAMSAQEMLCDNDLSRKRPAPPPEYPRKIKAPLPGEKRGEFWDQDNRLVPVFAGEERKQVPDASTLSPDQWVGVTGVDWSEGRRLRAIHTSGPAALSTQCFIFPICHDAYAYGRVTELQAAKRTISQQLVDPAIAELLKDNDTKQQQQQQLDKEGEEPEESDKEEGMTWPGVEDVLPVYRNIDRENVIYNDGSNENEDVQAIE